MAPSKKRDSGKQRDSAKHTSSSKREASSSNELFSYFSSVFGDRWPGLFQALAASTSHVAFVNAFQAHLYTPDEGLEHFYSTKSCSFLRYAHHAAQWCARRPLLRLRAFTRLLQALASNRRRLPSSAPGG
jgi:hypothetical protein